MCRRARSSRAYLFLGARETKRSAVADRRTVTMALAPSVYSRRQRLLAMGANSIEADNRRKPGRFRVHCVYGVFF